MLTVGRSARDLLVKNGTLAAWSKKKSTRATVAETLSALHPDIGETQTFRQRSA